MGGVHRKFLWLKKDVNPNQTSFPAYVQQLPGAAATGAGAGAGDLGDVGAPPAALGRVLTAVPGEVPGPALYHLPWPAH